MNEKSLFFIREGRRRGYSGAKLRRWCERKIVKWVKGMDQKKLTPTYEDLPPDCQKVIDDGAKLMAEMVGKIKKE